MGRRYIGIEMGDHAVTHCVPRLRKVIEGEQGGISEAVGWKGGGGFRFYRLGRPCSTEGRINPEIRFAHLAAHLWFSETHTALHKKATHAALCSVRHDGTAYYLLYNGILGDKRPNGGNVLTAKTLAALPAHDGPKVIYGEACRIGAARLKDLGIIFKQIPYDMKAQMTFFALKKYQTATLAVLRAYLEAARIVGAKPAFDDMDKAGVRAPRPYRPLEGLAAPMSACACRPAAARPCLPPIPSGRGGRLS